MQFKVESPSLEITLTDESGTGNQPAVLEIRKDNELLVSVQAIIERKQGADGGWYNCVTFRRIK